MREKIVASGGNPDDYPILAENARPALFKDLEWVWEGYTILAGSRQHGMAGPQPIAFSEMLSYLSYRGIRDEDDRREFLHLCQHLDRRFMAEALAKSKQGKPGPGAHPRKPSTGSPRR